MKKFALLLLFAFLTIFVSAQQRMIFSVGPELSVSSDRRIPSPGIGAGVGIVTRSAGRISFTAEISYNHFSGDVINKFTHDTTRGFSKMPILLGVRGKIWKRAYLVASGGWAIGVQNTGTTWAVAPGAGWLLHRNNKPFVDLGIRWVAIPGLPSFPENSVLNRGGYSYFNFRVAYTF